MPAGSHGIPPALVARNQRERLIAAMAEACAEKGYAEVSVADVVARAGISTATFYKRFASKRECMLAAHEELFERLLEEIDAACAAAPGRERVRGAIRTALELLAADPPTARLLTVEILALGPEGSELHAAAIEQLARRLPDGPAPSLATDRDLPHAAWAAAAALAALVGRFVMAGEASALPALEDELVAMVVAAGR